jgi:biopolymer transport protein ExbD/biopolymer transport protein TolR
MITAPVIQSSIDVNVPKTQVVRELAEEKLVVSIDKEQKLYLQNAAVNVNELGDKIRQKLLDPARQSVYLQADQSVPWQTIATVLERLTLAGIVNISIVTQPLSQSKK